MYFCLFPLWCPRRVTCSACLLTQSPLVQSRSLYARGWDGLEGLDVHLVVYKRSQVSVIKHEGGWLNYAYSLPILDLKCSQVKKKLIVTKAQGF